MLESLELKNFKSFLDQRFDFRKLTILAGVNASGKSSVVEAIDFIFTDKNKDFPAPDTDAFNLNALKSKLTKDNFYRVSSFWNGENLSLDVDLSEDIPMTSGIAPVLNKYDLQILAASRVGAQEYYKLNPLSKEPLLDKNGIYVFDYILKLDELTKKIDERLKYDGAISFKDNVNDWLQIISPNANLSIDITRDQKWAKPHYSGIEATETGFGISYSLPIIATLLDSNIKLLVVDSPEAHLHPKGQSELCMLIAKVVACGKQVILETHSDHIIDGIRVAIKKHLINCNDAIIYFLERNADEPSRVKQISIDSDGDLSEWPKDFFDQTIKDAGDLL